MGSVPIFVKPVIRKSGAFSALAPRPATYIYKSPMAKEPGRFTVDMGTGKVPGDDSHSR